MTKEQQDKLGLEQQDGPIDEPMATHSAPKGPAADAAGKGKGEPDKGKTPAAPEDKAKQEAEAKAKQQIDQERANAKRAREALEETRAENEQLVEELQSVRGELTSLKGQLKETLTAKEYKELADLDPEATDVPDLVKAFQKTTEKIHALELQNAKMQQFIESEQGRQRTSAAQNAQRATEEEIYSLCDEEFGAQFRTEAIRRADEMVDSGEVAQPKTVAQGIRLMRKAYAEVAGKHKPKEEPPKKHVPTDTGLRGLSVTDLEDSEEFKSGPLDEVRKDMANKMKAGKWKRDAFASSL